MKKKILLLPLLMMALGCATTDDLKRAQSEIDSKLTVMVDGKIAAVEEKIAAVDARLAALKAESAVMQVALDKSSEAVALLRKNQAETGADITDIRDSLQQLRGQADGLRNDFNAASTRMYRKDEEYKDLRERLNNAVFKVNFIENYLGLGKRDDRSEAGEKGEKPREIPKGKPDKESTYAAAYELFKDEKFDKARDAFQSFLKQYPDTEYSDNAQFWIGESYYFEKKYENAILEYEKVVKNYPDGDKVPYALLKEGITFLNLGDKTSARLILQRVIKDYPNTNQAATAKATLLSIK
ncbi:MAG: tol-pal system protein YbgF [Syntrophales bacterium LBB04]|nr:tol-pal system protein YbgF [Syntrophales bacterium LBB04]